MTAAHNGCFILMNKAWKSVILNAVFISRIFLSNIKGSSGAVCVATGRGLDRLRLGEMSCQDLTGLNWLL
jgi:hypothetical protein